MRVLFQASVPKSPQPDEENEDAIEIGEGLVAVCDGASNSFAPRQWAQEVARRYVQQPSIDPAWVAAASSAHMTTFDVAKFSWSQEIAAFERGSYSTLLGLRLLENAIELTAIGDSLAVLCSKGEFFKSFPYENAASFADDPELLCTLLHLNSKVFEQLPERSVRWDLDSVVAPTVLIMTDALGQYVLRAKEDGALDMAFFCGVRSVEEFRSFVELQRSQERLRNDDTTLVVLGET